MEYRTIKDGGLRVRHKIDAPWTPSEVDILLRRWEEGWTAGMISKLLPGRSVNATRRKANELSLVSHGHKRWTDPEKLALTEMWNQGAQLKHMERKLQRPRGSIMGLVRKLGLPRRRGRRGEQKFKVEIRVTANIYDKLYSQAADKGLAISEYLRQLTIKVLEES